MAKPTGFVSARAKKKMRNMEKKATPKEEITTRRLINFFLSHIQINHLKKDTVKFL
jgi:hypothetical protein